MRRTWAGLFLASRSGLWSGLVVASCSGLLWGCSVEIPEGRLRCTTDAECPPGYGCREGLCYAPRDAGPSVDAPALDALDAPLDAGPALDAPRVSDEAPVAIACGARHSCALTDRGRVYCWGSDERGQVGDDTAPDALPIASAALVTGFPDGVTLEAIDLGDAFSCALDHNTAVYCWGDNSDGQLGDPSIGSLSATPTRVALDVSPASLAVGGSHACIVDGAGSLHCWGDNLARQLGDGTSVDQPRPTAILPGQSFLSVTAGAAHTCALSSTNALSCWGGNALMQLGTDADPPGTMLTSTSSTPVSIALAESPTSLVAMGFHTCVSGEGSLACWGWNVSNQLGVTMPNRIAAPTVVSLGGAPTAFGGGSDYALSFGGGHTCAVVDGVARCWGRNAEGQLGRGATSFPSAEPMNVLSLTRVTAIAGGWYHSCAVAGGVGYCWGESSDGRLGVTNASDIASPIEVGGLPHR